MEADRWIDFTCDFIYITADERFNDGLIFDFNHKVTAGTALSGLVSWHSDSNYIRQAKIAGRQRTTVISNPGHLLLTLIG